MPIIALLLLAVLVAAFGFWDTLQGILGAVGVVVVLAAIAVAAAVAGGIGIYQRTRKRITRR